MSDYDDPSPSDAQLTTQREAIAALDPLAQGVDPDRPGYDTLDQGNDGAAAIRWNEITGPDMIARVEEIMVTEYPILENSRPGDRGIDDRILAPTLDLMPAEAKIGGAYATDERVGPGERDIQRLEMTDPVRVSELQEQDIVRVNEPTDDRGYDRYAGEGRMREERRGV